MLTELVKALEEKKATLGRELAEQQAKSAGTESLREIERRLIAINDQAINEYKALWQSFTPGTPFPCPVCFVFEKKVSPLKPLPRKDDVEPFTCPSCRETFNIPVELLYA